MTTHTNTSHITQRKTVTELHTVSYRDGWRTLPAPQYGINTSFKYENAAARTKDLMLAKRKAQRPNSGTVRLESLDTTEIFGFVYPTPAHAESNVGVLSRFDYAGTTSRRRNTPPCRSSCRCVGPCATKWRAGCTSLATRMRTAFFWRNSACSLRHSGRRRLQRGGSWFGFRGPRARLGQRVHCPSG